MTQAQRARTHRIRWAEEELRAFDVEVVKAWRLASQAIQTAAHITDAADPESVRNRLSDLFQDMFGAKWLELRIRLDDEGGDTDKFIWPLAAETKVAA